MLCFGDGGAVDRTGVLESIGRRREASVTAGGTPTLLLGTDSGSQFCDDVLAGLNGLRVLIDWE